MGKHHYTAPEVHVEETEVTLPKVEETEAAAEQVVEEVTPVVKEIEAVVEAAPVATGKVVGCTKLNVRRAPSQNATIVCEIPRNIEVTIDEAKSTDEWYHVFVKAGVKGYCMKKYIAISQ